MALPKRTMLDLDTARTIVAGCEARARQEGWRMVIAIADHGGSLKFLVAMDGALPISRDIAPLKAATSARIPMSTRGFREVAKQIEGLDRAVPVTTLAGGLPIMTSEGEWIGAVGVSGDSEDNDEICAQAGIDAARDLLS